MKNIYYIFIAAAIVSCITVKNGFSQKTNQSKKVLIFGNSITKHGPAKDLGWFGNWGMAASTESKDYVHLLMHYGEEKNEDVAFTYANVPFETTFWQFDLTKFADYRNVNPNIIIIELGENVKDSLAVKYNYSKYLTSLVSYLKKTTDTKVVLLSTWGKRDVINSYISKTATNNNWIYLPIYDIQADSSNTSKGLFANKGVAFHPSDKGMELIAQKIRKVIAPMINSK